MIGIVYSKSTGRIRWILYPDSESELLALRAGDGEAVHLSKSDTLVNDEGRPLLQLLQEELNYVTGLNPDKTTDLYAVVDPKSGDVLGCITCDPLCGDKIDEHVLVKDSEADDMAGWKIDVAKSQKMDAATVIEEAAKLDAIKWIEPVKTEFPPKKDDAVAADMLAEVSPK